LIQNLVGNRYGRWVVMSYAEQRNHYYAYWKCECDCGTNRVVSAYTLIKGESRSCGCLQSLLAGNRLRTHGYHKRAEYAVWRSMKARCLNPSTKVYKNYGGRGIGICFTWFDSFAAFIADMGPRPSAQHSLDRINNDGDYTASNCRWATRAEQGRNRRTNKILTHNGESLCLTDWAKRIGLNASTLFKRIEAGWTVERAITTPHRSA
jgi:hypothetical protein